MIVAGRQGGVKAFEGSARLSSLPTLTAMSDDTPSDPDEPRKSFLREFFSGFFREMNFGDWVEFLLYAAVAVGAVALGVGWLIGKL